VLPLRPRVPSPGELACAESRDADGPPPMLMVGTLQIHRVCHRVRINGRDVPVTRNEFALLWALARTPGEAVSRDALLDEVWGHTLMPAPGRSIST
jgi:DNA-binding response OmpR family regulator